MNKNSDKWIFRKLIRQIIQLFVTLCSQEGIFCLPITLQNILSNGVVQSAKKKTLFPENRAEPTNGTICDSENVLYAVVFHTVAPRHMWLLGI